MLFKTLWSVDTFRDSIGVECLCLVQASDTFVIIDDFAQLESIKASETVSHLWSCALLTSGVTFCTLVDIIDSEGIVTIGAVETVGR